MTSAIATTGQARPRHVAMAEGVVVEGFIGR
jgi:hypothetical protein